jgi:hypothetical protein
MRSLLVVLFVSLGGPAAAQSAYTAEEVKAAFLYNFAGFVDWPAHARANEGLVIGILGADDIESELRRLLAARPNPGRPVSVRRLASDDEAASVHVLFIGAREGPRLAKLLAALKQRPVLAVTEARDGLEQGAVINFVVSDRVRFEVSMPAADQAGLRLNPRLLQVALRIHRGLAPGSPVYAWRPGRRVGT